eukprot:GGOE01021319.1.p4 GENE.GGOE01021319.1~~GGOE01021319.1.p4  ORF type:complete len:121 (-),score=6.01 GGOE01021319.1:315-677(-)
MGCVVRLNGQTPVGWSMPPGVHLCREGGLPAAGDSLRALVRLRTRPPGALRPIRNRTALGLGLCTTMKPLSPQSCHSACQLPGFRSKEGGGSLFRTSFLARITRMPILLPALVLPPCIPA